MIEPRGSGRAAAGLDEAQAGAPAGATAKRRVLGWDIGGAHVKACLLDAGRVADVAIWPCALWQGLDRLDAALTAAHERWPALQSRTLSHAVTMTGEMVDLFADRAQGVQRIAALLRQTLPGPVRLYTGSGWCEAGDAPALWRSIASANWLATAQHAALATPGSAGVVIDIGSTTTDLIAFSAGRVLSAARSDSERLASGELVYHGVVRTPLCALARRIRWRNAELNVMNEFFATTADVYRLTGELNPAHDLHPSADNASKDLAATRQRLARMIGLDASDASAGEWLEVAQSWRAAQVAEIGSQLARVWQTYRLPANCAVVSAGCGDFLVPAVLAHALPESAASVRIHAYGIEVARIATALSHGDAAALANQAQVNAPSVAVAMLFDREQR